MNKEIMRTGASDTRIRGSVQKVRLVINAVKGKNVKEAERILTFLNKRPAEQVKRVILSAAHNAKRKLNVEIDDLRIHQAWACKSISLKRIVPCSKGRAHRICKMFSKVFVVCDRRCFNGTEG